MDKSQSAPAVGSDAEVRKKKQYNIKQYKGLLGSITDIKNTVEDERRRAKEKQDALEARMRDSEVESAIVQKELSVQLRCAGRSYQQLLGATRELSEQLRVEEDRRVTEIGAMEQQIKDLKSQLGQAAKPWKEEVSKRDLKILKLQEAAVEQEARIRKAEAAILPIREQAGAEVKAREEKVQVVLREIDASRVEYERQLQEKDTILEAEKLRAKKEKVDLLLKLQTLEESSAKVRGPYEKQIKELELKVQGLENQLDKVDYTPLEEALKKRELGYDKLVKDFRIKQQLNQENLDRMRAGFETTLEKMDKEIQNNEKEHKRRLLPWQELVEKREAEVSKLNAIIEELKEEEKATRKAAEEVLEDTCKELKTAKEAEELARQEADRFKNQVSQLETKIEGNNSPMRKIALLQLKLEEVTKLCEATVRAKDRELKDKTDLVSKLQRRVLEEAKEREELDKEWDRRVQQKEEGYGLVCANLAFAEGQIVEERGRTAAALATVKKLERRIERLKIEHAEEIAKKLAEIAEQAKRIRQLEVELDEMARRFEMEKMEMKREFAERYNSMRMRYEDQVAGLLIEVARRDRQLAVLDKDIANMRIQLEKARSEWEEKEQELEAMLRGRDRQITAFKNEIEFINDSWEVKYNRLMGLFEKLQKKYEDSIGPNGPQEAYRRAKDLKAENMELMKNILELKELIKKQKRQIRDLQLDYDMLIKETADLIAEKERGMAEIIGDMAKLQAQLRHEIELRERLVKDMTAEKVAIAASFEGRIRELEQQVEAMRFTDRQELLDTIDVWKRAYVRVCVERDELEDHYKALLDVKDLQVQKMGQEYAELNEQKSQETLKGQLAVEELDAKWKKMQAHWGIERDQLQKEMALRIDERDRALRERDRERGIVVSRSIPDPEIDVLRRLVKEKEDQLEAVEVGTQKIIGENTALRQELEVAKMREETAQADWEPQIRWRDERYEAMLKEHQAVKEILRLEMLKAQETCKAIEEQVRRFPSPFEDELKEAEGKYAQSQAGLQKLSRANIQLREQLLDQKEESAKDIAQLEEQLAMAAHILKEVASLGALKSMSRAAMSNLEHALGIDLDGDSRIG